MDFIPPYFENAPIGEIAESECSPKVANDYLGVAIAVPEQVKLGGAPTPVLPVCGYFQLPAAQAISGDQMTIHVRRDGADETFSAQVVPLEEPGATDEPEEPEPEDAYQPSAEALANTLSSGYFHVDAQAYLPSPLIPGTYQIIVTYAGGKSEPVTVEIRR